MAPPRISIALATYNGARFLPEQLNSLASQTYAPFELQVGDDGSSDDTELIVRDFATRAPFPVVFTRNEQRLGYGENFLRTATRCQGDWIAFCDQDDIWYPEKIHKCSQWIRHGPADLMLIVHNADIVDEDMAFSGERLYRAFRSSNQSSLTLPPYWGAHGMTQVFRAELVRAIPLFPRTPFPHPCEPGTTEADRCSHDVWIAILANVFGSIATRAESLVQYRRHSMNVTDGPSPKPSRLERIQNLVASHGQDYLFLAGWCQEIAKVFDIHQMKTSKSEVAAPFAAAASAVRSHSARLSARGMANSTAPRSERLTHLKWLLADRAYTRGHWPLGWKSLVKDAFAVLRSATFSNGRPPTPPKTDLG